MTAEPIYSRFPCRQLIGVRGILCDDGKRRTARLGTPDTFLSTPASVRVNGKTVSGVAYYADDDWTFSANGRNANLLPRKED